MKHLKVGVYDNSPLIIKDTQNNYTGLSVEMLEHIGSLENWQFEYIHGTWPECIERLKTGEIDLQLLIGFTPERDRVYDYTNEAVFVAWGQIYTAPEIKANTVFDLKDKRIAVYKDSLISIAFSELLDKFDVKVTLIEVENYEAITEEIKEGRADAGVFNRTFAWQYGNQTDFHITPIVFNPIPLYYAVSQGAHPDVIKAIDTHLSRLKSESGSIYYQLLEQAIGKVRRPIIPSWIRWTLIIITVLSVITGLVNVFLKRQVKAKTKELSIRNSLLEQENAERIRVEKQLLKWEHIFKAAKWGIAVSSKDGETINLINPAYAKMHGYSESELRGKEVASVFSPAFRSQLPAIMNKCHQHVHFTFEGEHVRKDGSLFPVYHDVTTIRDEDDQVLYRIVGVLDITDRKQAESLLKRYSEDLEKMVDQRTDELKNTQEKLLLQEKLAAIGKLSGSVAHDIRTPLGTISNSIYFLKQKYQNADDQVLEKYLSIMEKEVFNTNEIITDLLDYSKEPKLKLTEISINNLIDSTLNDIIFPETITLEKDLDEGIPRFSIDSSMLRRVVYNLVINSLQAMPIGGTLYVSSQKQVDKIAIIIRDNGTGISPENLDKIFEPLFTTKPKGVGLGLSNVKTFLDKLGGRIEVTSAVNKGTSVALQFPLKSNDT